MLRTSPVLVLALAVALVPRATPSAQKPRTHRLEARPDTVAYGYYWSEATPVLTIASGDIIDVDTLVTNTPGGLQRAGVASERIQDSLKAIVSEVTGNRRGPGGHILTGPVYVEGAEPGDVLEVKVLSIDMPIDYGYNGCSGFIPSNCERGVPARILPLDRKRMTAEFKPGIVVPLAPFFGSMGVAPAPELGRVSSNPPGRHAGNLDNRELVAGSTLFIPVFVRGALFAIGDGHAAQGDGEVSQTAIETSLRGRVQLTVRKDMKLTWPRAETAADYISMGTDEDLKVATTIAIQEMVDFLSSTRGLSKHETYQLVSIAGDVAITQLVDKPVYGVHAKIPKAIFKASGRSSGGGIQDSKRPENYRARVEAFRAKHEQDYRRDFVTIAGLHFLDPGGHRLGSDPAAEIVLAGSVPPTVGRLTVGGGRVVFEPAPGVAIRQDGRSVKGTAVLKEPGKPPAPELSIGRVRVVVHESGDRLSLRVWDPDGEPAREFKGFRWFPIDASYRVTARFIRDAAPRTLQVVNTLNDVVSYNSEGIVQFELHGRTLRLRPFTTRPGRLYFVFRDASSGEETYATGRFLYTDLVEDGTTVLDFNEAYNPPCAFNPYTTCPIPMKENILPVKILAGERAYAGEVKFPQK